MDRYTMVVREAIVNLSIFAVKKKKRKRKGDEFNQNLTISPVAQYIG